MLPIVSRCVSVCVSANVILRDLDLHFQDHKFEILTSRKLQVLSQKYVTQLLQMLIFAIKWHHCALNIFFVINKATITSCAQATITDTMDPFCSDTNLILTESQHPSQDLYLIPVFIVQINATD